MANLTIRSIPDRLKSRLRVRAAEHGRSMEEEARCILRDALEESPPTLADLALELFGPDSGVELRLGGMDAPRLGSRNSRRHSGAARRRNSASRSGAGIWFRARRAAAPRNAGLVSCSSARARAGRGSAEP